MGVQGDVLAVMGQHPWGVQGTVLAVKGQHPCGCTSVCISSHGPATLWVNMGLYWQSQASNPMDVQEDVLLAVKCNCKTD